MGVLAASLPERRGEFGKGRMKTLPKKSEEVQAVESWVTVKKTS